MRCQHYYVNHVINYLFVVVDDKLTLVYKKKPKDFTSKNDVLK